jgi:3-oxoacyl-[acyl-carrier-protein] synthase III
MIGIRAIASYVPESFEDNALKMERFGIDETFIAEKIGVRRVARKAAGEETSDMCIRAYDALRGKTVISGDQVDCVIVCTQNPDGDGIPHASAIIQAKLDLPESCAVFDISLGCSGYVHGLSVAKFFMEGNGFSTGLLFTCDPYSKILDPDDKNTVLLFGDAATVTLLTDDGPTGKPPWTPLAFRFRTMGQDGDALACSDGRLAMNGRAVFNFSARAVPEEVLGLMETQGLSVADIDLFCFHQASKYLLDTLCRRLQLPEAKVPIELNNFGNTVSSSIPLLLEDRLDHAKLRRIMICGFGVGLAVATSVIERQPVR